MIELEYLKIVVEDGPCSEEELKLKNWLVSGWTDAHIGIGDGCMLHKIRFWRHVGILVGANCDIAVPTYMRSCRRRRTVVCLVLRSELYRWKEGLHHSQSVVLVYMLQRFQA